MKTFLAIFVLALLGVYAVATPWSSSPLKNNSSSTNAPATNSPVTNSPVTNAPPTNSPPTNSPPTNSPGSGFYPTTSVSNVAAFWNYRDLPLGSNAAWKDEISGLVLTNWYRAGANAPTNTGMGVYFYAAAYTNRSAFTTDNNFSLWVDIGQVSLPNEAQIYGAIDADTTNLLFSSSDVPGYGVGKNPLNGYWGANQVWSGHYFGCTVAADACVTNSPLWNDIVDSQGTIYLNGVSTTGYIGKPGYPTVRWQALGDNDASANTHGFNGYIKYLLLCTNHAITAGEANNLWSWEQTNGVTNVIGGCVAWYKFNDLSNGTTIADSSGHGHTGTLYNSDAGNLAGSGRHLPIWTNGLNPVVNQSLLFNGSNTVYIPFTGVFTSPFITVSLWVNFTNGTAAGTFVSAYGTNFYPSYGGTGAFVGSDGTLSKPGNIRGGVTDAARNGEETGTVVANDAHWHHFVFATDTTNFYNWIDGVRNLGAQSGLGGVIKGPVNTNWYFGITNLALSWQLANVAGTNQPCQMTDIRLYNRVLNDAEVDILYRSPAANAILGSYQY